MTKYKVLKTILKMAQWGDMREELKIKEVTPMSKVKKCIIQLKEEIEVAIMGYKGI